MKVRVYYYLVADSVEDGMPLDGPFNTRQEVIDYAKEQYNANVSEIVNRDDSGAITHGVRPN
jgi:hypothetical protein